MTQTGQDASAMQVEVLRSPIIKKIIDFRRFQISLDPSAIKKLPNTNKLDNHKYHTQWLWDLGEDILGNIDMADVTRFDLMKIIGEQMSEYIIDKGEVFTKDLTDENGKDSLITSSGDIARIKEQLSNPDWIDNFKA